MVSVNARNVVRGGKKNPVKNKYSKKVLSAGNRRQK